MIKVEMLVTDIYLSALLGLRRLKPNLKNSST